MKKIVLYLTLLIAATSCQIDPAERNDKPTAYGATMFYYNVNRAFYSNDMLFDAVNLDIVAQTPPEKRDSVEDALFPSFKVRIDGQIYKLTAGNHSYMEVQTGNKSIHTVGAKWNVNILRGSIIEPNNATIECVSENCWQVRLYLPNAKTLYNANVTAEGAPVNKPIQSVPLLQTLDVELGSYDRYPENYYTVKTTTPLTIQHDIFDVNKYRILQGAIEVKNMSINGPVLDVVDGTFSFPSTYQIVTIDYRDVTENWIWQTIPEYSYYY